MAKKTKTTKTKKVEETATPVEETTTVQSAVTEEVKEKLEDAAESIVEAAKDAKHPWYTKVALYLVATIVGGAAFLFANYGDTIMSIIEKWLNGLAQ
jgi:hypothetical protein